MLSQSRWNDKKDILNFYKQEDQTFLGHQLKNSVEMSQYKLQNCFYMKMF